MAASPTCWRLDLVALATVADVVPLRGLNRAFVRQGLAMMRSRARPGLDMGRVWHVPVPLDVEAMHAAAQLILGRHDFTTFRAAECQANSPERTLDIFSVSRQAEMIVVIAKARSFLHSQVRSMVGSLKLVGDGKWQPRDFRAALDARDRARCGPLAPPDGLYLTRVDY